MPPWGNADRELTCQVSNGGVLYEAATCAFGGGPFNYYVFYQIIFKILFSKRKKNSILYLDILKKTFTSFLLKVEAYPILKNWKLTGFYIEGD